MRVIGIAFIVVFFFSCRTDKYESQGLIIDHFVFAKTVADGILQPNDPPVYTRGETVNMIIYKVGKLKKDNQGYNWFDIDIEVFDPNGKIVMSQKSLLGDLGRLILPDDIAESPYGVFKSTQDMIPGKYKMTLTIYDKIGTGKAIQTAEFELK